MSLIKKKGLPLAAFFLLWIESCFGQLPGSTTQPPEFSIGGYNRFGAGLILDPNKHEPVLFNTNSMHVFNRSYSKQLNLDFYELYFSEKSHAAADLSSAAIVLEPSLYKSLRFQAGRFAISGTTARHTLDGGLVAYDHRLGSLTLTGGIRRHFDYSSQFLNGIPIGRLQVELFPLPIAQVGFTNEVFWLKERIHLAGEPEARLSFFNDHLRLYGAGRLLLNDDQLDKVLAEIETYPFDRLGLTFAYAYVNRLEPSQTMTGDILYSYASGSLENYQARFVWEFLPGIVVLVREDLSRYSLESGISRRRWASGEAMQLPISVLHKPDVSIAPHCRILRTPQGDLFGGGLEISEVLARWRFRQSGSFYSLSRPAKSDSWVFSALTELEFSIYRPVSILFSIEANRTLEAELSGRGLFYISVKDWSRGL